MANTGHITQQTQQQTHSSPSQYTETWAPSNLAKGRLAFIQLLKQLLVILAQALYNSIYKKSGNLVPAAKLQE